MNEKDRKFLTECPYLARSKIYALEFSGVKFVDKNSAYIGPDVQVGKGTLLWPNCYLLGTTIIGENCEIEHDVHLENVRVQDNTIIHKGAYISESRIGKNCELWVDVSMHHAVIEDEVRIHKANRIVWTRVGTGSILEQGCQIKYADIGENCRICNTIIEGEKLREDELLAGKRTLCIRYSCTIGPWVTITGRSEIGPRAEILRQAKIIHSNIGYRTKVDGARVEDSTVSYNCRIGEGAHIHDNSCIESSCQIARCEIVRSLIKQGRHIHPAHW